MCTHLHVDHVGWNTCLSADGEWVPTFPNADYLFCAPEYDYWANHEDLFGDAVFEDSVAPIAAADRANMVEAVDSICSEVSFQSTPGHTPGHLSVVIQDGGKRAIITGDMAHTPDAARRPRSQLDVRHRSRRGPPPPATRRSATGPTARPW